MKNKSIKHWLVLIVCCGLSASSIGLSINASGVFYTPVCQDLGIMRGAFSMHMTIFSMVTALTSLFVPRILKCFSFKKILILSVCVAVVSTAMMGYVDQLWAFYCLGAIRGLSTSLFSIVPLTMIINAWFSEKHGLATSLVLSFSGIAGSLFSPVLTTCIASYGWQLTYVIKAVLMLCLCLPAILYPFDIDPRKNHLLPYGYQTATKMTHTSTIHTSFHYFSLAFLCFFFFGFMVSCITSLTQHFPGYSESLGYGIELGAFMLSASMIGNIVSKLLIGILSDHFHALKATVMMLGIHLLGVVLLLCAPNAYTFIIGAFFFGACYSIGAVGLPLLTKYFFNVDTYDQIFPKISFASNFGAAISISMIGFIYDAFGSYVIAFLLAVGMIAICFVLLYVTQKKKM